MRRRLGFLPRVEGGLDLAQHDVQRPAEAADLGARIALGHAPVQVPVRDLPGGLLDIDQRPQVGLHHHEPHGRQYAYDRRADDHVYPDQLLDGVVNAGHVRGDDYGASGLLVGLEIGDGGREPHDSPPAAAGLRRHGRRLLRISREPGGGAGEVRKPGRILDRLAVVHVGLHRLNRVELTAGGEPVDVEVGPATLGAGQITLNARHDGPRAPGALQPVVVWSQEIAAQDGNACYAQGGQGEDHQGHERRDQLGPQRRAAGQPLHGPPRPARPVAVPAARSRCCHGRTHIRKKAAAARTPRRAGYGSAGALWCPPCAAARTRRTRRCRCHRGSHSPRRGRGSASWTAPGSSCS